MQISVLNKRKVFQYNSTAGSICIIIFSFLNLNTTNLNNHRQQQISKSHWKSWIQHLIKHENKCKEYDYILVTTKIYNKWMGSHTKVIIISIIEYEVCSKSTGILFLINTKIKLHII